MCRRRRVLLAKSSHRYWMRIALSLDPDVVHVMWRRDEPISRLLLSDRRVDTTRAEVERFMRAKGLLK